MFRTHAYLRWSRGLAAGLGVSLLIGCPALAAAAQTHAGAPGSTALTAPATNPNASMDARNPRQSVLGRSQRDSDNVSSNLEKLFDKGPLQTHSLARSARAAGYRTDNDAVLLDVVLHSYNEGLQAAIDSAGGKVRVISEKYLRASVAVTDAATIEAIADLPAVEHVYPQYQAITSVGAVTSRAVETLNVTSIAGAPFNLTGAGQTIGILSDSFAHTSGVRNANTSPPACQSGTLTGSNPQDSGDLPAQVALRSDNAGGPGCPSGTDEGAAMAELVHDIAPGAAIAFHTAGDSQAEFASGIDDLCAPVTSGGAGANVVVDDIIFFAELMYQPGPVTQAAAGCVASGVPFFSAAGNAADSALHYDYVDVNPNVNDDGSADGDADGNPMPADADLHDWDPSSEGTDPTLEIHLGPGAEFAAVLQWNQPALSTAQNTSHGPQIDLDLGLLDGPNPLTASLLTGSAENQRAENPTAGADPIEIVEYTNTTGAEQIVYIAVDHVKGSRADIPQHPGTPLELRLVFFKQGSDMEIEYIDTPPNTGASTMYGHVVAPGVISVAAVPWFDVSPFASPPIVPEPFTALGGAPVFQFEADGTFMETPVDGPDLAAIDGNNTTFFGQQIGSQDGHGGEPDGYPNFFGTSAAAPNAAAVAALLQEYAVDLTPAELEAVLETTARDVEGAPASTGDDLVTGAGLIDAQAALEEFPVADAGPDQTVATGASVTLDGTGSTDSNAITAYAWSQVSGSPVTLNDADTAKATFTAPTTASTQAFELKVTDADGLSTVDTTQVSTDDSSSGGGGGGGGCTMGSGNGPFDPMLLLLVALSGLIMFRKKVINSRV